MSWEVLTIGQTFLTSSGRQPLGVDAVELVGLDPAHAVADVLQAVREVEHAALAEQDRVVEVVLQALPELEGVLVDGRALVPQVVRPDQGGVAGHVPARQPAPLQHRHVGDPVVLGQVVRGREAVPAAADDDHVVGPLGLRVAPQEVGVLGQVGPGPDAGPLSPDSSRRLLQRRVEGVGGGQRRHAVAQRVQRGLVGRRAQGLGDDVGDLGELGSGRSRGRPAPGSRSGPRS